MYHVSNYYCCTRYVVLTIRQDGNNDIVIANPAKCVIVIIVSRNIFRSVVSFIKKSLRSNVFYAYNTDLANSVFIICYILRSVSYNCLSIIESSLPPFLGAGRNMLVAVRNRFTLRHYLRA